MELTDVIVENYIRFLQHKPLTLDEGDLEIYTPVFKKAKWCAENGYHEANYGIERPLANELYRAHTLLYYGEKLRQQKKDN